jgi:hypothetical protein
MDIRQRYEACVSDISGALRAIMYLFEPNGGGGVRSMGLLYCLILSGISGLQYLPLQHTVELFNLHTYIYLWTVWQVAILVWSSNFHIVY